MQKTGTEILAWLLMVPALLSLAVYGLAAKKNISEHIEHH